MTRLNWEKARAEGKKKARRRLSGDQRLRKRLGEVQAARHIAISKLVKQYDLACFVCKDARPERWAKSGWSKRGPWAICAQCVSRPKAVT